MGRTGSTVSKERAGREEQARATRRSITHTNTPGGYMRPSQSNFLLDVLWSELTLFQYKCEQRSHKSDKQSHESESPCLQIKMQHTLVRVPLLLHLEHKDHTGSPANIQTHTFCYPSFKWSPTLRFDIEEIHIYSRLTFGDILTFWSEPSGFSCWELNEEEKNTFLVFFFSFFYCHIGRGQAKLYGELN